MATFIVRLEVLPAIVKLRRNFPKCYFPVGEWFRAELDSRLKIGPGSSDIDRMPFTYNEEDRIAKILSFEEWQMAASPNERRNMGKRRFGCWIITETSPASSPPVSIKMVIRLPREARLLIDSISSQVYGWLGK